MNGRESKPATLITTGMLSLGLLFPLASVPTVKNHIVAFAHTLKPAAHTVRLVRDGEDQEEQSTAATVGDLLREKGITQAPEDTISPSSDTPLTDGLVISYRAAFPVSVIVGGVRQEFMTSALDVATLLSQHEILLGPNDRIFPRLDRALEPQSVVRISRIAQWMANVRERTAPIVEHRLSFLLAPMASKVVSAGSPLIREKLVRFRRVDDNPHVERTVIRSRVIASGKPKVVVSGIIAYEAYARIVQRGFQKTIRLANSAFRMVATAYTANCYGCSGTTAIGMRAGHGIVAVDPRVIPLGTHLYIPGYGHALAGDTGGAIRGHRIDLGFESNADAMLFGRREVQVYVLK